VISKGFCVTIFGHSFADDKLVNERHRPNGKLILAGYVDGEVVVVVVLLLIVELIVDR